MSTTVLTIATILSLGALIAGGICIAIRQKQGLSAASSPTYYTWGSNLITGGSTGLLVLCAAWYTYLQGRSTQKQLEFCMSVPKSSGHERLSRYSD